MLIENSSIEADFRTPELREIGRMTNQTLCAAGCSRLLDLADARSCAILVCGACRKMDDGVRLRDVRARMNKHLREHLIEERKTNPWYPFEDFHAAWNAA